MSFVSRLLTALVGLALVWFFWPFGSRDEVVKTIEPPTGHEGRLFTTPAPEVTPQPRQEPPESAEASPPKESAEAPESKTAAIAPEAAQETKPQAKRKAMRYYRVVVRDGGTLEAGKVVITLEGIEPQPADKTCKDAKGKSWACGTKARSALTRLIRGRAVICKVPGDGKAKDVTARCTVGGTDLSLWMVTQGWVKPASPTETELAKAADAAQKKKIGVWR